MDYVISTHAPREGSDSAESERHKRKNISTHAPREGSDTSSQQPADPITTFQPTLPARGATHEIEAALKDGMDFNPRSPRGERRRGRQATACGTNFNPRSPRGERQCVAAQVSRHSLRQISTRAPREGSDCKYLQVLKSRTQQYRQTLHRITTKTALLPVQKRIFPFEPPSLSAFFSANLPENICALVLRTSQYQGFLRHVRLFAAKVLDLVLVPLAQIVKAQAVLFRIHDRQELCLQHFALRGVQQALKDGVLHPLPVVDTLLWRSAAGACARRRLRC